MSEASAKQEDVLAELRAVRSESRQHHAETIDLRPPPPPPPCPPDCVTATPIQIPDGPATPYPSSIDYAGPSGVTIT